MTSYSVFFQVFCFLIWTQQDCDAIRVAQEPPAKSQTYDPFLSLDFSLDFSVASSFTPSITSSLTPSHTPITFAPSFTPSLTLSLVPSITSSFTSSSLTPSRTPTLVPSLTPSDTPTFAPSFTPSLISSLVPSITSSFTSSSLTPSRTPTLAPSLTPSHTPTFAPFFTPSLTSSLAPTLTFSITPSLTLSPTPTLTPSIILSSPPNSICNGELHANQSSSNLKVKWSLINETIIHFVVTAKMIEYTGQWIGLGFSQSKTPPFMYPADVIIGVVPGMSSNMPFVSDRVTILASSPIQDVLYNIFDVSISIDNMQVVMEFSRNIISTDFASDVSLDQPLYWIWASGATTSSTSTIISYHGQERGVFDEQIDIFSCLTKDHISSPTGHVNSSPTPTLEPLKPYRFFMRFFVELINISNTEAESLSTIVEAIQFISDIGAFCVKVEMQPMDIFDRVECTVTGTTDPLQPDSTSTNVYYTIVNELVSLDYLQLETNISSESGFCNFERSIDERGAYLWVESVVGQSVVLPCVHGPTNEIATRTCASRLVWDIPVVSDCATVVTGDFVNVNITASILKNLTIEDVLSFAEDLSTVSLNAIDGVDQSVTNIEVIQNVMTIASQFYSIDRDVRFLKPEVKRTVGGFIQTLEAVETWPEENLQESGSSLTQTLNGLINNLALQTGIDNLSVDGQTISMRITQPTFDTLTFIAESSESLPISSSVFNGFADISNNHTQTGSISMLTTGGSYLVAYANDALFQSTLYTPSSVVMDLTLVGTRRNMSLEGIVNITLAIDNPDNLTIEVSLRSAKCGFWDTDLEEGHGDWSFIELTQLGYTGEHVLCQSTHLTAFAAFANFSDESRGMSTDSTTTDPIPLGGARLRLVSCLGIGVCLGFLLIVVVTTLVFENVRKKSFSVFHSQLCVATICLLIILLAGINSTANVVGCITVGTLLHYFILANWMWFAAEAGHLLIKTYFIFYKSSYQYLTIFSLICWGVPLLVIVVTLSVSPMSYINEEEGYCFIGNFTMFLTVVVVPMGLVVLMNIFIYAVTIIAVVKYDTDHPSQEKSVYSQQFTIKDIITITGLMVLFIVSAALLVQAFIAQAPVFQVFFATACIVYGVYAFAFFVVFSKDARDSWKKVFRICKCKKKYGYSVNRLNRQEVLGTSDATGVTVVSRQFNDEVHANPMAEEDTTFDDYVMPNPAILNTDNSNDANTSTDGSIARENVYMEVVGEIENIYSDPENLGERENNYSGNGTTTPSSENRLSKASSQIVETEIVVFENTNDSDDSDEIRD